MAKQGTYFKIDKAAVGRLLKSQDMLNMTLKAAESRYGNEELKPYIGADRAKTRVRFKGEHR